ncbi:MAG: hypothetical protein ACPL3B_05745 [Fervidobacterium sp.]
MSEMNILLITNIGRALGRVVYNIAKLNPSPTKIIYFIQKGDKGWDPNINKDYAEIINRFKLHQAVRKYVIKGKLQEKEISSISDYAAFFNCLASLIEEHKKYNLIYIDCSGLPKFSTLVVAQLAGMYQSMGFRVIPIYSRPKQTSVYDGERDGPVVDDEGWGPEQLPFSAIETDWLNNPNHCANKVLRAVYLFTEGKTDVPFNERDLKETLNKIGIQIGPRAFGRGRRTLLNIGAIVQDLTLSKYFRLTLLGAALASRFVNLPAKIKSS